MALVPAPPPLYDDHGVEEYYLYDPFQEQVYGWQRRGNHLTAISPIHGWKSPRLGITFTETAEDGVVLCCPEGRRFRSMVEVCRKSGEDEVRADEAERRAIGAQTCAVQARARAVYEQVCAEHEAQVHAAPEQQAAQETRARVAAKQRAQREAQARAAAKQPAAGAKAEIECPPARLRARGLSGHGQQVVRGCATHPGVQ